MSEVPLVDHIRRYVELSAADEQRLLSSVKVLRLEKRAHVFSQNEEARQLTFVESGLLRLYSIDQSLKEHTPQFALEGWWLADWAAFERGGPSQFSLQAVEASRVVVLPHDEYEPLLTAVPTLERYFRKVYQRAFGASQRRQYLNETSSGEVMYREFVAHYPEFVQRVPQYMLASFLGFTPEFLSKIRARS